MSSVDPSSQVPFKHREHHRSGIRFCSTIHIHPSRSSYRQCPSHAWTCGDQAPSPLDGNRHPFRAADTSTSLLLLLLLLHPRSHNWFTVAHHLRCYLRNTCSNAGAVPVRIVGVRPHK